ncbi:MAG: HU family DNA-binding protein [Myxococcota bacterium]|nr:HU family DNA-binding protein [Myxococcota bacterium]
MNKKEMAAALAKRSGLSQVKALEILNAVFDASDGVIAAELKEGNKVTIPGFGTFGAKMSAARTGTNPSSGTKMEIPARMRVRFTAGKTLKETVAG